MVYVKSNVNGHSRPITVVKQLCAWLVLGWVTAWEHHVLLAKLLLGAGQKLWWNWYLIPVVNFDEVSQIYYPHLHVGALRIFSDFLKSVQMLNREWGAESNGKLPYLFIPSNTVTLVPEFLVKALTLGRTLWWLAYVKYQRNNIGLKISQINYMRKNKFKNFSWAQFWKLINGICDVGEFRYITRASHNQRVSELNREMSKCHVNGFRCGERGVQEKSSLA